MKIALGNLKLGNIFSYEGKEYKASGIDSKKAVNSILCIAKDNSRIWLDVDTPVEIVSDVDVLINLKAHWEHLLEHSICMQDEGESIIKALNTAIEQLQAKPRRDLISRSALKAKLNSMPLPQDYSTTLLLGMFNDLIDNAQAVGE